MCRALSGIKAFEVKRGGAAAGGRFHGRKKVLGPRHDGRGEEAPQSCLRTRTSFPCPCYGEQPYLITHQTLPHTVGIYRMRRLQGWGLQSL